MTLRDEVFYYAISSLAIFTIGHSVRRGGHFTTEDFEQTLNLKRERIREWRICDIVSGLANRDKAFPVLHIVTNSGYSTDCLHSRLGVSFDDTGQKLDRWNRISDSSGRPTKVAERYVVASS